MSFSHRYTVASGADAGVAPEQHTAQPIDLSTVWPTSPYVSPTISIASKTEQEEEEEEQDADGWHLKLPIRGTIAKRRARKRGEDLKQIEREQHFRFMCEHFNKHGPLMDVEITFRQVDWESASLKPATDETRDSKSISPKSVPEAG